MTTLFPLAEAFRTHWLPVDGGHRLFVAEYGRPDGVPVLVLHGGPGSGGSPRLAGLFDPARCRVIVPDQRGAGRSEPAGATRANTTADLLADIERIRAALGLERWFVTGGSWGATLGILHAAAQPARVAGLLLRSPFLARRADLDHFFGGARHRYPAAWRAWAAQPGRCGSASAPTPGRACYSARASGWHAPVCRCPSIYPLAPWPARYMHNSAPPVWTFAPGCCA